LTLCSFYFLLVKTLLEELECLVENVYGSTLTASLSALEVSDSQCLDNMLSTDCCSMEVEFSVSIFLFLVLSVLCSSEKKLAVCNDEVKWKMGDRVFLHKRRIKVQISWTRMYHLLR
jgi:hypothetical protein